MPNAPVYLLSGPPSYAVYADGFVAAAGGKKAKIVALVQNETGWQRYQKQITTPWLERGVTQIKAVFPGENGLLDSAAALEKLDWATGIFIGGGKTPIYHQNFATGAIRDLIREKHSAGTPYAGISAGALLAMEICQFGAEEMDDGLIRINSGLGLVSGFVIGVHFTEWQALPEVLEVMMKTRTPLGLGIDEPACVVCRNGQPFQILGRDVYRVDMTDFEHQAYRVTKINNFKG